MNVEAPIASSTGTRPGARWVLWAIAVVSLIAAIVVVAVAVWPAPRAGLTPTPAPSAEQLHAQQVVTAWVQAADSGDTATVRQLTCANPTGTIARDLPTILDPTGYRVEARDHIDGFFRYAKTRNGAQIDVMYRQIGLTPAGRQHAAVGANNFFGDTYVLVNEDGELKVCGAIS
ncbi:hypothetical protein QRB41_13065 [Mycobacterium avium subsp. hominissuis]|uniref:hypothetical protein n=1 Tax=Mycobacteriaceae TaxID=1762 RepID=UPI000FB7D532|nr:MULTISPECIES: hypothetical protein [Mycobacteriaceae]MDO2384329.1 hypothetical protein [Mycobacterium avium subsp. hominissuis]MDO2395299.1 hypothetical protein [Mycobacterium avium subsp. hominissuis]RUP32511.1 MAG: hypothetical protein EKK51_09295 [Mycolicibacterium sp.]